MAKVTDRQDFAPIQQVIETTMHTTKCLPCGCLHEAVDHLSELDPVVHAMGPTLEDAYELMQPIRYGCLGCEECPPVEILPLADRLAEGTKLSLFRPKGSK